MCCVRSGGCIVSKWLSRRVAHGKKRQTPHFVNPWNPNGIKTLIKLRLKSHNLHPCQSFSFDKKGCVNAIVAPDGQSQFTKHISPVTWDADRNGWAPSGVVVFCNRFRHGRCCAHSMHRPPVKSLFIFPEVNRRSTSHLISDRLVESHSPTKRQTHTHTRRYVPVLVIAFWNFSIAAPME